MQSNLTLEIDGAKWTFTFEPRKLDRELKAWVSSKLPDPLKEIKDSLKDYPASVQEILVKDALEQRKRQADLDSPEAQRLLSSSEGMAKVVQLYLKKQHPDISEEKAGELCDKAFESGQMDDFNEWAKQFQQK